MAHHGNTPAAWAGVLVILVGFVVGGIGLVIGSWPVFWVGVVIGLLGKFVAPCNRDNIPLWLTVVCGVLGIFLGTYLYVDVLGGSTNTPGVDWLRHLMQVLVAAVLVAIACTVTRRNTTRRR